MASLGLKELTLVMLNYFLKHKTIFSFFIISQHRDSTGSWIPSCWKTWTFIYSGRIWLSVGTASCTYKLSKVSMWHPSAWIDFIRLGSVTINRKNGFTEEHLAVNTDLRSVNTGPSFVFWLKFHESLFLRVQLLISQHLFIRQVVGWCQKGDKPLPEPLLPKSMRP